MSQDQNHPQGGGWLYQFLGSSRDWLEKLFEPRTLKLLVLAALSFVIAILVPAKLGGNGVHLGPVSISVLVIRIFVPLGSGLTLLAVLSGLLELRHRREQAPLQPLHDVQSLPVLGGNLIFAIDVGRSKISYGALRIDHQTHGSLSPLNDIRAREVVSTKTKHIHKPDNRQELYHDIADAVAELVDYLESDNEQLVVDGLAITTPSWIDIEKKLLDSPIGPFPVNERLAEELASLLWSKYPERIRRAFGTPGYPLNNMEGLLAKIFLDTDARSVARYDLYEQFKSGNAHRNYACIIALEGVGSGLVLNGEIYYGSHGSEGEVGHTTVHLAPQYMLLNTAETVINSSRCDCELPGFHWETLASMRGLLLLASAVDRDKYFQLSSEYQQEFTSLDFVNAACYSRTGQGRDIPKLAIELLEKETGAYEAYFAHVLTEYARIFTIGVANLANILDLEVIVMGGPLITLLDRLPLRNEIRSYWDQYVLRGQSVRRSYKPLSQLWQGAALLFWDPAYRRQISSL